MKPWLRTVALLVLSMTAAVTAVDVVLVCQIVLLFL